MTNKNGHSLKIGNRYHLELQQNRLVSFELLEIEGDMAKITKDGESFMVVTIDSLVGEEVA